MDDHRSGCMVCGAPLRYIREQRIMECAVCHRMFLSNAECENGHFVCDSCHGSAASTVESVCLSSESRDPTFLLTQLMRMPGIHMHGPEHHVLVGSAVLTAYRNAGGDLDLEASLSEMRRRGMQVPGGVCGLWGSCGAAVSCGMAYSIITGSTPLSEGSWGRCNLMTSRCLEAIGSIGGPRCCKRDGYTAIIAASRFIEETLGISMDVPASIRCGFSASNPQCIGSRCPYNGDA